MKWPPLVSGILIKRYKRFIADVRLSDGSMVSAHCPNSGSMLGCSEPGRKVWLSTHDNPKRRFRYTWEMIEMPDSLVGINTLVPNRLVKAAVSAQQVPRLLGYKTIRSEVKYGENSRIDLLLENEKDRCFVEIKNCTLVGGNVAYFPDAVTSRGLKHLVELQRQVRKGDRAVMFYLVQRMDAEMFRPANHIDPAYGEELKKAVEAGVEVVVYDVHLDLTGIRLNKTLPFHIP